jgi:hypothetical protein
MGLLPINKFHITRVSNGWILEYVQGAIDYTEVYEHYADMTYQIEILAQSLPKLPSEERR